MPRSPRKSTKSVSKSTKTPIKSKKTDTTPTTPLGDASNVINNPAPPTTPRVIDFTLSLDELNVDGWSSDDSFEEKITWSRHRMRVTPGGFTPRNIQVSLLFPQPRRALQILAKILGGCADGVCVGSPSTIEFGEFT